MVQAIRLMRPCDDETFTFFFPFLGAEIGANEPRFTRCLAGEQLDAYQPLVPHARGELPGPFDEKQEELMGCSQTLEDGSVAIFGGELYVFRFLPSSFLPGPCSIVR